MIDGDSPSGSTRKRKLVLVLRSIKGVACVRECQIQIIITKGVAMDTPLWKEDSDSKSTGTIIAGNRQIQIRFIKGHIVGRTSPVKSGGRIADAVRERP